MSRKISQPLIFLTGCINPNGMMNTLLQDSDTRKQQYIQSIRFYLTATQSPVLFVENSGIDISAEFESEIESGRLEIITFEGNNYNKNLGKGYGEMLIIEKALNSSEFIKKTAFIFKITGRYKVLNINSFINDYLATKSYELLVDLKHKLMFSDSRLFGCTPLFLSKFLLVYKNRVNDSKNIFFEHALCKATHEAIREGLAYSSFKFMPRYSGTYGTDNTIYNDSWYYWFPRNIKYWLRYKLSV